jgi:hypothetical protein
MTVVGASAALALTACGASSHGNGRAGVKPSQGIAFADCMRAHGVPNFPDPGSGGGIQLSSDSGINPASPAFQDAQKACGDKQPGALPGKGPGSETQKLALLKLARCMRGHGFTSFPDPTATPPQPGNGLGIAFGGPGGFIAISQSMMQSPGFQGAAATCGFPGFGRPGGRKTSFAPS